MHKPARPATGRTCAAPIRGHRSWTRSIVPGTIPMLPSSSWSRMVLARIIGTSGRGLAIRDQYEQDSLSLAGAVSLGTGVMIGAGLFALTGQIAALAGVWFPVAFLGGAVVTAFSAYTYVKMSNAFPSAGGIAMYLQHAFGRGTMTGAGSLLMYLSMVISESLVARTFGTYSLQLVDVDRTSLLVPLLGVLLLAFAFLVNISGNALIDRFAITMAVLKIGGIAVFAIVGLSLAGFSLETGSSSESTGGVDRFVAAVALSILAYKGFTTITNSGGEVVDPHRNVGRAIVISIAICVVLYTLVAFAVAGSLTLDQISAARDFALAEAARPAFGEAGLWFTVLLAIVATVSGVTASVFAVSRMLAMLTDMNLVPHRHFGMPGRLQQHTLVYTIVLAMVLTVFFDLSRIAALGAVFYLVMDMQVHWGVLRHLREEIGARASILITAITLDAVALGALLAVKATDDALVLFVSVGGIALVFGAERLYLERAK